MSSARVVSLRKVHEKYYPTVNASCRDPIAQHTDNKKQTHVFTWLAWKSHPSTGCSHRRLCKALLQPRLTKAGAQLWATELVHFLPYDTKDVTQVWRGWGTRDAVRAKPQCWRRPGSLDHVPKHFKSAIIQFCNGSMRSSQDWFSELVPRTVGDKSPRHCTPLTVQYQPRCTACTLYTHKCSNTHL